MSSTRSLLLVTAAIASGVILGTSFIPYPAWGVFFGFAPLWWAMIWSRTALGAIGLAWLSQAVLHLVTCSWLPTAFENYFSMPAYKSFFALFCFVSFASPKYIVAGATFAVLRKYRKLSGEAQLVLLASLYALADMIVPGFLPWNFGYSWLAAGFQAYQFADVIGFEGLNAVNMYINAIILALVLGNWNPGRMSANLSSIVSVSLGLLIVIGVLHGAGRVYKTRYSSTTGELHVLGIQGNIANDSKMDSEVGELQAKKEVSDRYVTETLEAMKALVQTKPDLVIWPETAHPGQIRPSTDSEYFSARVHKLIHHIETPLLTGGYYQDDASQGPILQNALYYIEPRESAAYQVYRKVKLMPFGEYVPFADKMPWIADWAPRAGSPFAPASRFVMLKHVPDGKPPVLVGAQICYEGIFPAHSRDLIERGASMFVSVANDGWFDGKMEPYQHLYLTLGRAVEFRRPLVRITNSGVSGAIQADGTIEDLTSVGVVATPSYRIRLSSDTSKTVYFYLYGWLWLWPLSLVIAALITGAKKTP